MYCWSPAYHKQPEVPFKALEIITGTALTDALRLHIYCTRCTVRMMHISAFHWCKILKKKLGGPLIISQTAEWSIQCIRDHRRGRFDWHTKITNIYNVSLTSLHITAFHSCRILSIKHGGHLIISQADGWSIQCTGDHRRGRVDSVTEVTVGILHITNSQMIHSMHWRSLEGLLLLTYWD